MIDPSSRRSLSSHMLSHARLHVPTHPSVTLILGSFLGPCLFPHDPFHTTPMKSS